jgi:hypothetical protein
VTRAVLIAILAVFAVAAFSVRQPAITTGEDDAEYVLLSRALLEFHYRDLADVSRAPHTRYPPGYPAALAGVSAIFGERLTALTSLGIAWSLLTLVLTFAIARPLVGERWALAVCALVAVNPSFLAGASRVVSEPQFTAFTTLALWAGLREPRTAGYDTLAGVAAIAGAMTRLAGVTLVIALLADWVLRRRFRSAIALAAVSVLTIGAWLTYAASAPDQFLGASYIADARSIVVPESAPHEAASDNVAPQSAAERFARRSFRHAQWYATQGLPYRLAVPTIPGTIVDNVFWVVTLAALLVLGAASVWRQSRLLVALLVVYAALLVFWRWGVDRFLDPVIPLILLAAVAACATIGRRVRPWLGYAVLALFAGPLAYSNLRLDAAAVGESAACDRDDPTSSPACFPRATDRAFFAAAQHAATTTGPHAVFVTPKEHTFFYYSGRKVFSLRRALALPEDVMLDSLRTSGVEHIVVAQLGPVQVPTLARLSAVCGRLQEVRQFDPTVIVFRIRDADVGPDSDACAAVRNFPARF